MALSGNECSTLKGFMIQRLKTGDLENLYYDNFSQDKTKSMKAKSIWIIQDLFRACDPNSPETGSLKLHVPGASSAVHIDQLSLKQRELIIQIIPDE